MKFQITWSSKLHSDFETKRSSLQQGVAGVDTGLCITQRIIICLPFNALVKTVAMNDTEIPFSHWIFCILNANSHLGISKDDEPKFLIFFFDKRAEILNSSNYFDGAVLVATK